MNSIQEHHTKFKEIIKKYNLDTYEKSEEISHYITKHETISVKEFSTIFAMDEKDARIFLSFIHVGIKFKENHLDSIKPK